MLGTTYCTIGAILSLGTIVSAQVVAPAGAPVPRGKAIQWVGHSFHWFLPEPVASLAKEYGIKGHVNLGVDRIGASTPCQHWNKGGDGGTNAVKTMVKSGKADVMTLASQQNPQEPCVPKFAELAAKSGKKGMKVMVQETWLPNSPNQAEDCTLWGCSKRDAATFDMLENTRVKTETPYRTKMRAQLMEINAKAQTNITTLVPVWDAVLSLRQLVVKGGLPGVAKQSNLFMDNLGHPQKSMRDLASYIWFGALYGINPIGSKALGNAGQAALLQKMAWDTLTKEPLNGLKG